MTTILLCALALGCPRGGAATTIRGGPALPVIGMVRGVPVTRVRRLRRFYAWVCIHGHEAAWGDRGDPYWGGLQMDRDFMRTYGQDIERRHRGGLADTWTPAEQIVVAERAYVSGRGFGPWPNTARMCGYSTAPISPANAL